MKTEITGNKEARGWVCYDADCGLCSRSAERARGLLERHGFRLLPLQTPGITERFGVAPAALMSRMHLFTTDGRIFAGADALVEIARHVRWARLFVAMTRLPAVLPLLRRCYDRVAANRYCLGGRCRIHQPINRPSDRSDSPRAGLAHKRRTRRVFFEMP